jgi:hypothetical protein
MPAELIEEFNAIGGKRLPGFLAKFEFKYLVPEVKRPLTGITTIYYCATEASSYRAIYP